ncbi:hypothetical protein D3C83_118420 [compost metagenome]
MAHRLAVGHQAQRMRPERHACREVADDRRQREAAAGHDRQHAAGEQHEDRLQREAGGFHPRAKNP